MNQKSSHEFFTNLACKYYPCHTHMQDINCLFCFCPLYYFKKCGGNSLHMLDGIKDCSGCTFPHHRENYDDIIKKIKEYNNAIRNK